MTITTVTGGRAAIAACAALVLTATAAGCARSNTSASSSTHAVPATTTSSAVAAANSSAATTTGTDGELSVGETPWWQLPAAPPPSPSPSADPPPQHFVLSGGVLFEPNSPALTAGASTQLGVILAQILGHPRSRLAIDGFTNANGGSESTAVTLSAARAGTVKAWFIANGIPAARVTTHGWGDSHPIYPRPATAAEAAANRRCEITVSAGAP